MKINKILLGAVVLFGGMWASMERVSAHGYIANPPSRAYQGSLEKDKIGWNAAQQKYGGAADNPQGLETVKGFGRNFGLDWLSTDIIKPSGAGLGPADEKITSANDILGAQMAVQKENYWNTTTINTGKLDMTWEYTATHPTSRWTYYITKPNWNPNEPVTRADLELIKDIQFDGSQGNTSRTHTINIPENRIGYHVIISAWDVADTQNAFYQAVDVNINNDNVEQELTAPQNLTVMFNESQRIGISWDNSNQDVREYEIFRDDKLIGTSKTTQFIDEQVAPNTSYQYTVVAINKDGKKSKHSERLTVKTLSEEEGQQIKPTVPGHLHSMSSTESSVDLMWSESVHSDGISYYEIYRDGMLIAQSETSNYKDVGLQSNTIYSYKVRAIAVNGLASEFSNELTVTTKESAIIEGSWDKTKAYKAGEEVSYKTGVYKALWHTINNIPDESDVWMLIDGTEEWSTKKAYQAKSIVQHQGKVYEAKVWTRGEIPGISNSWKEIN